MSTHLYKTKGADCVLSNYFFGKTHRVVLLTTARTPVFCDWRAARHVVQLVKCRHEAGQLQTLAYALLPDRLEWVLRPGSGLRLPALLRDFKQASSERLGRPIWQAGFEAHVLDSEDQIGEGVRQVLHSPVKTGLVRRLEHHPHWEVMDLP